MSGIIHEAGVVRHQPRETVAHVRLALVGDQGVGKSTLLRLLDGAFPAPSYEMTTQPAVSHRVVPLAGAAAQVSFIIVDCPGAASLNIQSKPLEALWGGCGAAAVCFDVASRDSLAGAGKWLRRVQEARVATGGAADAIPVALVGLRAGAGDARGDGGAAVGAAEAGAAAAAMGARYFAVDEKPGSAAAPFAWLAEALYVVKTGRY
jgi:hypothetical protein